MFGEGNGTGVEFAEAEPGKDNRWGGDALEPEGIILLAGTGKFLPWLLRPSLMKRMT